MYWRWYNHFWICLILQKPVTYSNNKLELQVGKKEDEKIIIDADDFLNAPLSENKRYSKLRKLVESKINEFDLDELLQ